MSLGNGHPGVFDGPKNELEECMTAARNRQLPMRDFVAMLLKSKVYILVPKDQFSSDPGPLKLVAQPVVFCLHHPSHSAIGLFTHLSRTRPVSEKHPEFRFAAEVEAGQFISGLVPGSGIAINPYWDINMEWESEQVARMRDAFGLGPLF